MQTFKSISQRILLSLVAFTTAAVMTVNPPWRSAVLGSARRKVRLPPASSHAALLVGPIAQYMVQDSEILPASRTDRTVSVDD